MSGNALKGRRPTRNIVNDNPLLAKHLESTAQDIADLALPIGTILMFDGTGWSDNKTLPGFYICDGRKAGVYGNTPNLVGYFIKGAATSGTTTAASGHVHEVPAMTTGGPSETRGVTIGAANAANQNHTHNTPATDTNSVTAPEPANYTVIFVKKMHD